jgi:hypothetical protein
LVCAGPTSPQFLAKLFNRGNPWASGYEIICYRHMAHHPGNVWIPIKSKDCASTVEVLNHAQG